MHGFNPLFVTHSKCSLKVCFALNACQSFRLLFGTVTTKTLRRFWELQTAHFSMIRHHSMKNALQNYTKNPTCANICGIFFIFLEIFRFYWGLLLRFRARNVAPAKASAMSISGSNPSPRGEPSSLSLPSPTLSKFPKRKGPLGDLAGE